MAESPIKQRSQDFAAWYQDVVLHGDMAEPAEIVKGCMVIKPNGYAVWEVLQREPNHEIDKEFVLETIVLHMPQENYERMFSTFVRWARFGDLFAYDDKTGKISMYREGHTLPTLVDRPPGPESEAKDPG